MAVCWVILRGQQIYTVIKANKETLNLESCTLTTLHCSKVSFLQCCHMKRYNKIFAKMWRVYSLLWDTVYKYIYIYVYIIDTVELIYNNDFYNQSRTKNKTKKYLCAKVSSTAPIVLYQCFMSSVSFSVYFCFKCVKIMWCVWVCRKKRCDRKKRTWGTGETYCIAQGSMGNKVINSAD